MNRRGSLSISLPNSSVPNGPPSTSFLRRPSLPTWLPEGPVLRLVPLSFLYPIGANAGDEHTDDEAVSSTQVPVANIAVNATSLDGPFELPAGEIASEDTVLAANSDPGQSTFDQNKEDGNAKTQNGNENDDDDLVIVEVRKLDKPLHRLASGSKTSKKHGIRHIKQEPGLEPSSTSKRKFGKPKTLVSNTSNGGLIGNTRLSSTSTVARIIPGMPIDPMMIPGGPFDPYAAICEQPWDLGGGNGVDSGTDGTDTNLNMGADSTGMESGVGSNVGFSPFDTTSASSSPGGALLPGAPPPAYQPKTLEQIIHDANSALEERIYSRLSRDITKSVMGAAGGGGTFGLKRGRGVAALSLDEAETNLKTASAEYARAKAADDRRANKRGRSKKEDEASDKGEKGEKGEKATFTAW